MPCGLPRRTTRPTSQAHVKPTPSEPPRRFTHDTTAPCGHRVPTILSTKTKTITKTMPMNNHGHTHIMIWSGAMPLFILACPIALNADESSETPNITCERWWVVGA